MFEDTPGLPRMPSERRLWFRAEVAVVLGTIAGIVVMSLLRVPNPWAVVVPLVVGAVSGIVVTLVLARRYTRRVRRGRYRLCPRCEQGLDPEASRDRCPECGHELDIDEVEAFWRRRFGADG